MVTMGEIAMIGKAQQNLFAQNGAPAISSCDFLKIFVRSFLSGQSMIGKNHEIYAMYSNISSHPGLKTSNICFVVILWSIFHCTNASPCAALVESFQCDAPLNIFAGGIL